MTPDLFSTTTAADGPHPLPDGWRWLPFATVAQTRLGKMLDKRKNLGTPRRYLRNINVRWHGFDLDDLREMRVTDDEMNKYTVRKGDLVICEGGEPGRAAIWPHDEPMVYQKALHRARPRKGVDARFLLYVLEEAAATGRLAEHFTGSTINHLTGRELARVQVPLPPLDQQRAIVDALDALLTDFDHGVAALRDTRQRLDRYRQSVLQAAVEGRLTADWRAAHPDPEPAADLLARALTERRQQWEADQLQRYRDKGKTPPKNWQARYKPPAAPDPETLPDLPDGWMWANLDQLTSYVTSGSRGWSRYYSTEGAYFVRVGDLARETRSIDWSNVQRVDLPQSVEGLRSQLQPYDLVISITADIGMVGVVNGEVGEAYISQHVALARPALPSTSPYLASYLVAPFGGLRQFQEVQRGATKMGLGLDDIRNVELPLPPLSEQVAIADAVEDRLATADAVAREIDDQLARADALRRSALRHAMRGALTTRAEEIA